MANILNAVEEAGFTVFGPSDADQMLPIESDEERERGPRGLTKDIFEDPRPQSGLRTIALEDTPLGPRLFRYFLDGSMRTTAAGTMVDTSQRYLPIFVAQLGVAVTQIRDRQIELVEHSPKAVLFLPNTLPDNRIKQIRAGVSQRSRQLPTSFSVETYGHARDEKPIDGARKKMLQSMHSMEVQKVADMAASGSISRDALLLIDGSLQFGSGIEKHREAFRNVVGVAKSFDMQARVGSGKSARDAGTVASTLPHKHRSVARIAGKNEGRQRLICSWYLRLHPVHTYAGLGRTDGVIKIEIFPDGTKGEKPLDKSRCDSVSRDILELSHPTTPHSDKRWASHLYPIHLTERYIKSRFLSQQVINACL